MHCHHHTDDEDEEFRKLQERNRQAGAKKKPKGMDISIRFFDSYNRAMDSVRKSLDAIREKQHEQDAAVNFGVGYVENKKITHGISVGGVTSGIYGGRDIVYSQKAQEYLLLTKMGDVIRFDWAGSKILNGTVTPSKKFTRFIEIFQTGHFIGYNPGKSFFYIYKDDWTMAMDTVCISHVDKMFYGGRKTEENAYEFFIVSGFILYKYAYNPTTNVISLQDVLQMADIEAEGAVIEETAFDQPMEDKKQWIYLTFKQHATIIDVTGRVHGTKKHLHKHRITAIVAYGPSDFVVTGDEKGLLKMWGARWALITEIHPQSARITHLIEHPNGRAVVSFSADQTIFAWSLDTKLKLESMKAPEMVERIAVNPEKKAFVTNGARKIVLWKMDVLFIPLTQMSAPISNASITWHPEIPTRAVVYSVDNAVRIVNPATGRILKTALVNPPKPTLTSLVYIPQNEIIYALKTPPDDPNLLEIQLFDGTQNPSRVKESWSEMKWDTGITAIALYDYHVSIIVPEKGIMFSAKKQNDLVGPITFIIAGMRDGCLARIDPENGQLEYKTSCHKGQVNRIEINPEMNQFVSMGTEPSIRLWKVDLLSSKDELYIPLLDISWKFPIHHVALVREVITFALSHHDSPTHKIVIFNTFETERYDHREHFAHLKEILSISSCRELMLFCSASKDETIRIWNEKAELIRLLVLNWAPVWAGFGTPQGDILVGIGNMLHVVPADKYLSIIYRNRAIMDGLTAGEKEVPVPLNAARSGQDPRMYFILEEEDRMEKEAKEREKEQEKDKTKVKVEVHGKTKKKDETELMEQRIPGIGPFHEPKDSQRAQDYAKYFNLEEDLLQIVEGNHNFSIQIPDFRKMTKKQLDDYGKSIFPDDEEKRKMFVSESRIACLNEMEKHKKELDAHESGI